MPLTSVEERLFAGLAAQAGLVLRGARLRAELEPPAGELSARAEELRALAASAWSTPRTPSAGGLERDIHDGAQQHLVALAVNLRLAQTLADRVARAGRRAARRAGAGGRRGDRRPWSSSPAASTRRCSADDGLVAGAARRPSATSPMPVERRGDRRRPVRRRRRGGGVLLLPGGAAERRQARRRVTDPGRAARRARRTLALTRRGRRHRLRPGTRCRRAPGWPTCATGSSRVGGTLHRRAPAPGGGTRIRRPCLPGRERAALRCAPASPGCWPASPSSLVVADVVRHRAVPRPALRGRRSPCTASRSSTLPSLGSRRDGRADRLALRRGTRSAGCSCLIGFTSALSLRHRGLQHLGRRARTAPAPAALGGVVGLGLVADRRPARDRRAGPDVPARAGRAAARRGAGGTPRRPSALGALLCAAASC